ncbi:hypothetical protein [Catenulispora sp. GAS73]|uniref:hypothetical protein n=1 Tax=Catenulispora sp. GAS73 TaxID=3156269 RepID=UPI003511A018
MPALFTAVLGVGGVSMSATASANTTVSTSSTVSPNAWVYSGRFFYNETACRVDGNDAVNELLAQAYACNYEWNNRAGGPVWDEYWFQS